MKKKDLIVVRGAGDLATGTIHRLKKAGFRLLVLEAELSLILVTHMLTLLIGKKKQKILLEDSSRTLLNTKETLLVKHLLQLVLSYNYNC